jgi:hypothetical protein
MNSDIESNDVPENLKILFNFKLERLSKDDETNCVGLQLHDLSDNKDYVFIFKDLAQVKLFTDEITKLTSELESKK